MIGNWKELCLITSTFIYRISECTTKLCPRPTCIYRFFYIVFTIKISRQAIKLVCIIIKFVLLLFVLGISLCCVDIFSCVVYMFYLHAYKVVSGFSFCPNISTYIQSSRWALLLRPKTSKTLFGTINFTVFI